MTTTTEAGGMEAGREPGQTAFEAYWQDDAHSAWSEGRVHADTKALWARVEAALATARPDLTEAMIEAACRAAAAVFVPSADADLQVPRPGGGTWTIWESGRPFIEPALKAALDRDTIPAGHVERVRHLKRGTDYEVLHRGVELQVAVARGGSVSDITGQVVRSSTCALVEGDRLVIYQGSDGKLWAREESEFDDGRFKRLDRAAAPQSQEAE